VKKVKKMAFKMLVPILALLMLLYDFLCKGVCNFTPLKPIVLEGTGASAGQVIDVATSNL